MQLRNGVIKMSNNLSKILGERLLKISTVAKETGISRTTLTSIYYKRNKGISNDVLLKLCNYLKITPNDFFPVPEWLEHERR